MRYLFLAGVVVAGFLVVWRVLQFEWKEEEERHEKEQVCEWVYLDFGTNIGVQIRKLFEPERYPNNPTEPFFTEWFGANVTLRRERVCAVGFEPNPMHAEKLDRMESCYNQMGWRTRIHRVAVSDRAGVAQFGFDPKEKKNEFWGAKLGSGIVTFNVSVVDAVDFVLQLPSSKFVGAKFDIEGSEFPLLTGLKERGALCRLHSAVVEWHVRSPKDKEMRKQLEKNRCVQLHYLDDETFLNDGVPLPCSSTR